MLKYEIDFLLQMFMIDRRLCFQLDIKMAPKWYVEQNIWFMKVFPPCVQLKVNVTPFQGNLL